jgi:hypothetical protein
MKLAFCDGDELSAKLNRPFKTLSQRAGHAKPNLTVAPPDGKNSHRSMAF